MARRLNVKKILDFGFDLIFAFCLRVPKEKGIPLNLIGTLLVSDYGQ